MWMSRDCVVWSLLVAAALMTNGCASTTPPGHGRNLGYSPRVVSGPVWPEVAGGALPRGAAEPERQSATLARQAVLEAVKDVKSTTGSIANSLSKLAARPLAFRNRGLNGMGGSFKPYAVYGDSQLRWLQGVLGDITTLADAASEVEDPDMELALLRLTGPRLQAVMSGATLLAAWVDFLNLADAVLRQCPFYGLETLFMQMYQVQKMIEPSMTALTSLEPGQVEATATAMPEMMGQLTRQFNAILEAARVASERGEKMMAAAQIVEMITMISTMKLALPRLPPPTAPALLGAEIVMGSGGVMMGPRIVVTAEWVEMMRRLVQAGVISVPVVSAAVRIHAGQVMMAQAHQELPQGVRDALGDGPEVSAMHETGKAGAGMSEPPRHHVLPDEFREWFEERGFKGAMNIDQFCVELETAEHQAIHGGGDWRLGRMWPDEWNQMIMRALSKAENEAGRLLTRNEILNIVARYMKNYGIPMTFTPGRGR